MAKLGIKQLIITNAAGVNTRFRAGDLMMISDHINFSGDNPLIGENLDDFGLVFQICLLHILKNAKCIKVHRKNCVSIAEGAICMVQAHLMKHLQKCGWLV